MNVIRKRVLWTVSGIGFLCAAGFLISTYRPFQSQTGRRVRVPQLSQELVLDDTVFWEPLDTQSLRELLIDRPEMVRGKTVLEIGTGSGLIAICCAEAGAERVVATDINPNAVSCAKRNAKRFGHDIDFRLVTDDPSAFAVVGADEKFDIIISNPPWENDQPAEWADFALYDPSFQLLRSIIQDGRQHLSPDGRILLAYGCVAAIREAKKLAAECDMQLLILDERDPESLPEVFLPGMLLGLLPE